MKIYHKIILAILVVAVTNSKISAQVGMMSNSPYSSAALDLGSVNKGIIISSFSLASTTDVSKIAGGTPAFSLMVYNTNPSMLDGAGVGYYYWDAKWKKMSNSIDEKGPVRWNTFGNLATDPTQDFLGTTNAKDLIVKTNGNEIMRVTADTGAMGIGVTAPDHKLDVNAGDGGIRFRSLPYTDNATYTNYVVIDDNGEITKTEVLNVAGQQIKLGFNSATYPVGESALRFDTSSAVATGKTPAGTTNFVNTIKESVIKTNITKPAGSGSPSRTTDAILLPKGVYRVTTRLAGNFSGSNMGNKMSIKVIVNNSEYSFGDGIKKGNNTLESSTVFSEVIILPEAQELDFTIVEEQNSFKITAPVNNIFTSILMIERLR